eukprot:TRINITY_DN7142_c0_g2_i2.p1 TRINITY_DN7142_c0_g2~~TRINITY_DN7142_c0_g2_i2.p1  ORF type:complete len:236 (+),score=20.69 TRINITY_DN7142_c0_g2_i2:40-747(+)
MKSSSLILLIAFSSVCFAQSSFIGCHQNDGSTCSGPLSAYSVYSLTNGALCAMMNNVPTLITATTTSVSFSQCATEFCTQCGTPTTQSFGGCAPQAVPTTLSTTCAAFSSAPPPPEGAFLLTTTFSANQNCSSSPVISTWSYPTGCQISTIAASSYVVNCNTLLTQVQTTTCVDSTRCGGPNCDTLVQASGQCAGNTQLNYATRNMCLPDGVLRYATVICYAKNNNLCVFVLVLL